MTSANCPPESAGTPDPRAAATGRRPQRAADMIKGNQTPPSAAAANAPQGSGDPAFRSGNSAPGVGGTAAGDNAAPSKGRDLIGGQPAPPDARDGDAGDPAKKGSEAAPAGAGDPATKKPGEAHPAKDGGASPSAAGGDGSGGGVASNLDKLPGKAGELGKYLPRKPEGDNLREKAGHLGGQIGRQALQKYAAAHGIPPEAFDKFMQLANSKAGRKLLEKNPQFRALPKSVREGFLGGQGGGEAEGKGKAGVSLSGGGAVIFVVLVVIALVMATAMAVVGNQIETQPDSSSDKKVTKNTPDGWMGVLHEAADTTSNRDPFAVVPWTVLGGIAQAQTEFGRYSPYDSIDRDPGRKVEPIGTGGGGPGGAGDPVVIGPTSGAGPGPVQGVSGPGNARSIDPNHQGPPAGTLAEQLGWYLYALRMHESNGNYQARNSASGACGAYQYLTSTWNNYKGYRTACEAPPSIQDRRVIQDTLRAWNRLHTWQQVAANHFHPAWAPTPSKWNQCPALCNGVNPTVWEYVDDNMRRMRDVARQYPPGSTGSSPTPNSGTGSGGPTGSVMPAAAGDLRPGVHADGCQVKAPAPAIGGKSGQGVGPYLLTWKAAWEARYTYFVDPQDPCGASRYVARKLADTAEDVHKDPESPKWEPYGSKREKEEARKYWSRVIAKSGIFAERSATPDQECEVPPPDGEHKWSISFKIIYLWQCEAMRRPELYLVTGLSYGKDGKVTYTVEEDRVAATRTLIDEALQVSYAATKWETDKCDRTARSAQGLFPMTWDEGKAAGLDRPGDRCDVDKNIQGAAKLVLDGETVKPEKRPTKLGDYQPMIGGWQLLGIAMGTDLETFAKFGPGMSFTPTPDCSKRMRDFLAAIGPQATEFAQIKDAPPAEADLGKWKVKVNDLAFAAKVEDPGYGNACSPGAIATGYHDAMAQVAADLAGSDTAHADNLNGLGNYYLAMESTVRVDTPVPGDDPLVIPRLATRPFKEAGAPIAEDASDAWNGAGLGESTNLSQLATEYAWFFGGMIAPFDTAGELIGSLESGAGTGPAGGTQITVGPDGCPTNAPPNTLRQGADKVGIEKLCADSVAQARTPEAANAIKWALTHLGWPYSQPRRNENGYADCSSFVTRAYLSAIPGLFSGNAPTTHTMRSLSWIRQISLSQAQPGDFVQSHPGHVAMQLADGYKVHTNTRGDVSKVERAYTSAYWVGYVVPPKG